jgi:hypothetical protein
MTEEELSARYDEACQRLEQARQRAEGIVETIRDAAEKLREWRGVSVKLPPTPGTYVETRTHVRIKAADWPTAQQLNDALEGYHEARQAADSLRNSLTEKLRRTRKEPPA